MWNTILFDLDGTLTDSGEGITRSVQYALSKGFGIEVQDIHELDCFVGPPLKEMFINFAQLSDEEGERAVELYRERYTVKGIYENSLYNGIPELLRALKERGFTLALASSKPEVFCRQIVEYFGIAEYFAEVVGSRLDGGRTKKADVIEEALRRLHMDQRRGEVVMVGDRDVDVLGARQTGVGIVAVSYGYGPRAELEGVWPDCIVDSPKELGRVLIGTSEDPERQCVGTLREGRRAEAIRSGRDLRLTGSVWDYDGNILFRIWRVVYPLLIDLAISSAVGMAVGYVLAMLRNGSLEAVLTGGAVLATAIAGGIMIPIFYLMMRADDRLRRAHGTESFRIPVPIELRITDVPMIVFFAISACRVVEIVVAILVPVDAVYQETAQMIFSPGLPLQILAIGIIGPVMEELLFRGLLMRRLRDYVGFGWAAVISSAVFGIAHGNLTQGIFAALAGLLFSMLYEHYGTTAAPIAAHIANNAYAVLGGHFLDELPGGVWLFYILADIVLAGILAVRIFSKNRRKNVV